MSTKKTIIYIGGFELPDKNAAAQRVLSNAKIFKELGFNVILVGIDRTLPISSHINDTNKLVQGFETWSIPYPSSKKLWLKHITSNKYIEYLIEKYYHHDLYSIISYNYPAIALYKIKNICKKRDIFCISDTTEWHESSGGGIIFNTIKWLDTSLRMRIVQLQSNGIISISKYLTNFYKKRDCLTVELPTLYDVKNKNINTIENESNTIDFMYAGSAFYLPRIDKNRTNIKDRLDKIIILFDNVSKYNTNFRLNIYGLTKENYLQVFSEHTEVLKKLSKNIIFHGRKPHIEIVKNIQKSDFTIFIRNIERVIEAGFPSKFSESISYGTPVVSNMISNIENYVEEEKNSYIISLDDEKEQVKKMLEILSLNRDEIKNMKIFCLNNKIFDYREYISSVKNFLEKLEK